MPVLLKEIVRYVLIVAGGAIGFPFAVLPWLEKRLSHSEVVFNAFAQAVALFPGRPGNFVRTAYYLLALESFHTTAVISFGSYFSKRASRIGRGAGIGAYCVIGLVDIEADVRIASRVSIVSGLHYHGRAADIGSAVTPPKIIARLRIGEGAWIGEGAIVGANIGRGCIVAIGSAVTNDVPDYSMAMGNPARLIPVSVNPPAKVSVK